jgi:DNA-binding response OmpR family regulator
MASILIIDDTDVIRDLLQTSLERAGYAVRVAKDGHEGLREFRKASADLVITDIYMPDCDGIEVIRGLRRLSPEVKILAISGGTGTKDSSEPRTFSEPHASCTNPLSCPLS